MNEEVENLKRLLSSESSEDFRLALSLLQSGYFDFEDIKELIYEFMRKYQKGELPSSASSDEVSELRSYILDTIISHSENITNERRKKI